MNKKYDLTGQTFNRLTVLYLDEKLTNERKTKDRQYYWVCKCECGTITTVSGRNLRKGKTKSCGCLSIEVSKSKLVDLTGKNFGSLTVLKRNFEKQEQDKNKYRVYWDCLCECGNKIIVEAYELKSGGKEHCGCKNVKRARKDLKGKRFGRLYVIEVDEEKTSYGKGVTVWKCRCDCGNYISIPCSYLDNGTQSCGCLQKDKFNEMLEKRFENACKFGDFIIKNLGKDYLEKYYDYKLNKKSPFEYTYGSKEKVWMKCENTDYHGSYEISISNFTLDGHRCPYCSNQKVHKNDSFGSICPEAIKYWSDKNELSVYEIAPNSQKQCWFKCKDNLHEDYLDKPSNFINRKNKCAMCYKEYIMAELVSGENNYNWKGGITSILKYLRCKIKVWKNESLKKHDNTCILTGSKKDNVIHHVYQFNDIVCEAFLNTGLELKEIFTEYSQEELDILSKEVVFLHYKYGLGVCINKKLHMLYHQIYGYKNTNKDTFEEFKENYKNNKYNIVNDFGNGLPLKL